MPNASVNTAWEAGDVDLPLRRASIRVADDGLATSIAACGHGLQRAFILTLLKRLAVAQPAAGEEPGATAGAAADAADGAPIPDLVLVIEEPELFQHPSRQRHFAEVVRCLASESIPGGAVCAQVIYCTHSPHFVGVDRFAQVRLFRKVVYGEAAKPKVTRVSRATLPEIAQRLAEVRGETAADGDGEGLRARLSPVMTPNTSEGFFADVAVLVEGEGDRAAILATADALGVPLESNGVAVIPCTGKSNVLSIAAVLKAFGIATYCVWDADAHKGLTDGPCGECQRPRDKKSDPKENHWLLRLHGAVVEDVPPLTTDDSFACFNTDLETTMQSEIGKPLFGEILDDVKGAFGPTKLAQAIKNSRVLAKVLRKARERDATSVTLEAIVRCIAALRAPAEQESAAAPEEAPSTVPAAVADYGINPPTVTPDAARPGVL